MTDVAVSHAREHLADVIDQTRRSGEPVYVTRRGRRVAVIIDSEVFERVIENAEDAIDRYEAKLARDEGVFISWEEVQRELGLE